MASDKTFALTPAPTNVCNTNPESCGCPLLAQANYRGTINTTHNGEACVMWSDDNLNSWRKSVYRDGAVVTFFRLWPQRKFMPQSCFFSLE